MKSYVTLGAGLFFGLLAGLLARGAGLPGAAAAFIFWLVGAVFGLSLLQFAFFRTPLRKAMETARREPLRSFLLGLLVLEIPILGASCLNLIGARPLAVAVLVIFFGALILLFWPAAVAQQIGSRLLPQGEGPQQILVGSAVTSGTCLVPVFGWAWLLILALMATGGLVPRIRHV